MESSTLPDNFDFNQVLSKLGSMFQMVKVAMQSMVFYQDPRLKFYYNAASHSIQLKA